MLFLFPFGLTFQFEGALLDFPSILFLFAFLFQSLFRMACAVHRTIKVNYQVGFALAEIRSAHSMCNGIRARAFGIPTDSAHSTSAQKLVKHDVGKSHRTLRDSED